MPKSRGNNKPRPSHAKRMEKKLRMAESLNPFLKKYLANLEAENEQMKTDPNTTVGKLIPQMREAISQNKRLSVLAAALIEAQGGAVTITKTSLEAFESKVLNIKWTLPEGSDDPKTAESFIFTYEAKTQEEAQATLPQVVITPEELTREEKADRFIKESGKEVHASDCATSVAPAEEPGPCDCDVETTVNTEAEVPLDEEVTLCRSRMK